ncbi:MAG: trimethylamine methyltransferase family protein [Anaerolineales bacterium]|nr:trimethylamine methyltransferase family protein [Anaerolineales bacterium]
MTTSTPERRSARRQKRPESPLLKLPFRQPRHPWAPLEVISADQLEDLHVASLRLLEETGIDMLDAETLDLWQRAGAKVDRTSQHIWIDRALLMATLAHAPAAFRWRARNPAHDLRLGGNVITFFPQAGMAYVSARDLPRQPGTEALAANFYKLGQMIPVMHASFGSVEPQDVPVSARHLRGSLMQYQLTDKAAGSALHGRVIPADAIEMAKIVFGDPLPADPVLGSVINCSSPLRYDARMLGGAITYARAGQAVAVTPFIMAGATSPVSIAAAIAQQNAEALAGLATLQLARPGAPVIYGGFTTNIDLRSGSPSFGTPEGAWALAVGAQLARRYRLPYRGSGSLCTAKTADAQAAYETMWTLWPAVMAHTNLIIHSAGWIDGGLTTSFEKFILDVEMLAMFQHFLAGFEINADTLALDSIAAVGPGGHHFGTAHTQARYLTEHYQSFVVGDRQNFETWQANGAQDAEQRANAVWKDLLAHYERPPLDAGLEDGLKDFVARRERELAGVNLYDQL